MSDLDTIDPTFKQDLENSKAAVRLVADYLVESGYPVTINPTFVRPDPEQRAEYADDGDLSISMTVEVKGRDLDFTSAEDYPFPTIFIDKKHTFDAKRPKPYAYFLLNKARTHAFIVPVKQTRRHWTETSRFFGGREQALYEIDVRRLKTIIL